MEIRANEYRAICSDCHKLIDEVFAVDIGDKTSFLCFSCVIELRDLCHEATCGKDVTGKCDCFEGVEEDG